MDLVTNCTLRLALLAARTWGNHVSCTPPNPPAPPNEKTKYMKKPAPKFGESGFTIVHAAKTAKILVHIINVVEFVALLSSMGIIHLPPLYAHKAATIAHTLPSSVVFGSFLLCAGALLRAAAYRHLGRFFTFELSIKSGQKLVTDGPYALVRHPSYTGMWMYAVGAGIAQLGPGSAWDTLGLWDTTPGQVFAVTTVIMLAYVDLVMVFLRVEKEDAILREEFREEWTKWAARTPWKLIPCIY